MIKIKQVEALQDYTLRISFDNGRIAIYDVKEDLHLPGYDALVTVPDLFYQLQLDESRTCIFWNEYIDYPSDMLYEYAKDIS